MTHTGTSGGAFPAIGDVGLVGVVGVAQERAGGRGAAAAPRGARFTQLDSALVLGAAVRRGGLTPLGVGRPGSCVLAHCVGKEGALRLEVVKGCSPWKRLRFLPRQLIAGAERWPTFRNIVTLTPSDGGLWYS